MYFFISQARIQEKNVGMMFWTLHFPVLMITSSYLMMHIYSYHIWEQMTRNPLRSLWPLFMNILGKVSASRSLWILTIRLLKHDISTSRGRLRTSDEETSTLTKDFGHDLMKGLIAYKEKRYDAAVELLHPIRYELVKCGGSNAQVCKIKYMIPGIMINILKSNDGISIFGL